jgi:hypothetical protein
MPRSKFLSAFRFGRCLPVPALLAFTLAARASAAVVLDDPLQGSTSGTRSGGAFAGGGWKVTGKNDFVLWHIPTVKHGAVEWQVKGLNPGECRAGMEDHAELFHMYDFTYSNSDVNYAPGYRDNPFKHFVRKQGCIDLFPDRLKLVWKIGEAVDDAGTNPLSWDPARTYRFREEWGPDGTGGSTIRLYRDGALIKTSTEPGSYAPVGHSVRIGASTRRDAAAGAPLDAVFSNVKVWDLDSTPPAVPILREPAAGTVLASRLAFLSWSAAGQSRFQARVNAVDDPEAGIVWDSLEAASAQGFIHAGPLPDGRSYYAFVRAGNSGEWSEWSSPGRAFRVDAASVPPGPDLPRLEGNAIADHGGPFLALGASYFSALRIARNDRNRLISDLDFLASSGFRYLRVLSMVGWNASWQGMEIAPVGFQNQNGVSVAAWPDYWQQFRDLIDLAYQHGLRTEVTIFADAQLMPDKTARLQHLANLLANLSGREHKVILLEVANEAWQNGFPGSQGTADLREFGKYLGDRTAIPIALSAPAGGTNDELTALYSGSAADVATVHFSRDLGTVEGGWFPVRDPWRVELASGVPPASSNEPIGPGSSVSRETDPVKLVMAAAFAWGANLPMYVFHSSAGVRSLERFEDMAGAGDYARLAELLPPDLPDWPRNDGKEAAAPFTVFAGGQPNRFWPEVPGAQNGVVMNTGKAKGAEWVTLPIGILAGGVELEARRAVSFQVLHPLTGQAVAELEKARGERFTLARGPGAYVLRGVFTDVPSTAGEVSIDLGAADRESGLSHPQSPDGDTAAAAVGGRDCRRNVDPAEDLYFYFRVGDGWAFQGSRPRVTVRVEYLDAGSGALTLEYDSSGTGLAAQYRNGGTIPLGGTNAWLERSLGIQGVWFGNRQNAGADFRIGHSGGPFYLDRISVSDGLPEPPLIAEVIPDPESVPSGGEYRRQLRLLQGHPAPDWALVAGPPGARIDSAGLVQGWTPGAADEGRTFTIEVEAENEHGQDRESWRVAVIALREITFPFTGGAEGFALSGWKSGPYDPGTAAWEPSGGNPGGNLLSQGAGDTNNVDSCTREGGIITRTISTAGLTALRVEFEAMTSLAEPPGPSGIGNCPVLLGTGEDKLAVSYSTSGAAGPWTTALVMNEGDLPASWKKESIDLSGVKAAEQNPAFALRFQWQFNARDDAGRLDNVRVLGVPPAPPPPRFRRGDSNGDRVMDLSDAITTLGFLFLGEPRSLECEKSADADDSGVLDLTDVLAFLNHLFLAGPAPPPPFDVCGADPTADALGCAGQAGCQ